MIKLQSLLLEAEQPAVILGAVTQDLDVVARPGYSDVARHPEEWNRHKRWRYVPEIEMLGWWESPTEEEVVMVKDYLTKKGYPVTLHYTYGYTMKEGVHLDSINQKIAKLEAEWDQLDSQGTGYARQMEIQKELQKLWREKKKWEKLHAAVNENELLMTEASQDEAALDFLKQMVRNGPFKGHVYLAGGAVRDMVRGETPKDLDIVITDHGETGGMVFAKWLAQQMGNFKEGSNPVLYPKFGTAKVNLTGVHNKVDLEGFQVEAVFARKEVYTPGSRKPEVFPGTIEDDAFRRDFTVNSMMLDLTNDKILDITGRGRADIQAGIIRSTSNPDEIFGQDALRMFRAIRFATKYDWNIEPETWEGIKNNLDNLGNTSRERIRDELDKILQTKNPRRGFELLRDSGLLPHLAPEFQKSVGMTQNVHHSEDVFGHTLSVLQATKPELVTRLIALFHDIGKVVTRTETPTGVHFYGHEDAGAEVVERIMSSLKYPTDLINAAKLGVKNHMRLKGGGNTSVKLADKTLRRFKIEMGDQLENILDVIHADNISHADASSMPDQIENVRKRLQTLDVQVKKPTLPINGNDLMALGLKPGPLFSQILGAVTDAWYSSPNISKDEALAIAKQMAGL